MLEVFYFVLGILSASIALFPPIWSKKTPLPVMTESKAMEKLRGELWTAQDQLQKAEDRADAAKFLLNKANKKGKTNGPN